MVLSLPRTRAPNPGRNSSTTQEEDTDIRTLLTSIPEHDSESDELKAGAPDRERDGGYPVDKRPVVAGASHFIEGAPVKSKYRGSRPDGEPECSQQKEPGKVRTDGEDFSNAASKESEFSDDEFDVLRPSREKLGDYELTLFGRIWNTLSSSITNKTINYLTDLQESLPSASEKDIDSCLEARDIFYRQILTGINNILRRNCIELSLSDDIIALLDTLTIKQASGLVLSEIDRNCISSVLLRCLADKIKSVGTALNRKESLDSPTVWENIISSSGIDQLQMELMVQLFKRTF